MERRNFIKILGIGTLLAASGGTGYLLTRTPKEALEPWQSDLFNSEDVRLAAAAYAILAPNPHNRQPWLLELGQDKRDMRLFFDETRQLPATDPFDRQLTMGLGCFLELLTMAAAEKGHRAEILLFPEGSDAEKLDSRPVAEIRLQPDNSITPDQLFAYVLQRRSCKEPFDLNRPVSNEVMVSIAEACVHGSTSNYTTDSAKIAVLRDIAWRAHETEMYTPRTREESIDLMRVGKRQINASPDGIDLGGAFFELLQLVGQMDKSVLMDTDSSSFKQGFIDNYREKHFTSMAFAWIITPGNSREDQIAAGRDYVRQNLAATSLGISMHPISQGLQEYAEMLEVLAELHATLNVTTPARIQMLSRFGYGPAVDPSPRWKIETRLVKA